MRFVDWSYAKTKRWADEMVKTNQLVLGGRARLGGKGRGYDVYVGAGFPLRLEQLTHDVICSKFTLPFVLAGFAVSRENTNNRADATVVFSPLELHVEIDTGSENSTQVVDRLNGYRGLGDEHFVLFVTTTERRILLLSRLTRHLVGVLLFATFDEVAANPLAAQFRSVLGTRAHSFASLLASITATDGQIVGSP